MVIFQKLLTKRYISAIISFVVGSEEYKLRNSVRVALVTLTHSVRVQILMPQPSKKNEANGFIFF